MKYVFNTLLGTILWMAGFATAQYPDKIFYKGKEYELQTNPLENYFKNNPYKRPSGLSSTALWRGYVATFEIRDSQLYVKDIQTQYWDTTDTKNRKLGWKSVLTDVFPEPTAIKVDWLTGLLVLPYGKMVNYVHMGYGSMYKNYFILEINNGNFTKAMQFNYKDYEKFKGQQFLAYKQTDEYKRIRADLQKEGHSDEFIDNFLRNYVVQYSSKILTE